MRLVFIIIFFNCLLFSQEKETKLKPGAELDYDFSFLPKVVSSYSGKELKAAELIPLMNARLRGIQGSLLNERQLKHFVVNFLEDYYQRVISLELAAKDGFEPNIGLAYLRLQKMEKEKGRAQVMNDLKSSGLPYSEAPRFLAETRALDEWFEKKIVKESKVEEAEALFYYSENQKLFDLPARVQIAEIYTGYLKEKNKAKARKKLIEAMKELQVGTDFEDMARKYSEGQQAKSGGVIMHFFSKKELKKELHKAFEMKEGEISDIIPSPGGFHIIKVLGKTKPGIPEFDEIKEQLMAKLSREKAFKLMELRIKQKKLSSGYRIFIE